MSDDRTYTVKDLLAASFEQKPLEFRAAFDSLISPKLTAAVDDLKVEVAKTMYASVPDEPEPETKEEGADANA
jgi:hypothetical protein